MGAALISAAERWWRRFDNKHNVAFPRPETTTGAHRRGPQAIASMTKMKLHLYLNIFFTHTSIRHHTHCRSCDELTPYKHLLICLAVVFHRHLCLALCWWRYSQTFCWWPGRSSPLCPHCTSPRLRHDHGTATQHLTGEETEHLILYEIYKYIYKKHFFSFITINNQYKKINRNFFFSSSIQGWLLATSAVEDLYCPVSLIFIIIPLQVKKNFTLLWCRSHYKVVC